MFVGDTLLLFRTPGTVVYRARIGLDLTHLNSPPVANKIHIQIGICQRCEKRKDVYVFMYSFESGDLTPGPDHQRFPGVGISGQGGAGKTPCGP